MYCIDMYTILYDYDLTSAYTTVMAKAGHPDYDKCRKLTHADLAALSDADLIYSYLIIHTKFNFPPETKYPSIPCFVDENCTIFPLRGVAHLTGAEFLLARNQGCEFEFEEIILIPFQKSKMVLMKSNRLNQ